MLALAAVSSAAAQDPEPVEDSENLDVTMRLLPEGATGPDAVTRVIELPEAVRARMAERAARERDVRGAVGSEETRRAAAARAGAPEDPGGPVPTTGPGPAMVGASDALEPAAAGREVGDTVTMSSAREAAEARREGPDAASRELDRGSAEARDARDGAGRGAATDRADRDRTDAGRSDADRPDRDRPTDTAGRADRGDRAEPADRPERRDLPERGRRSERADPSGDDSGRDDARDRPDRPEAENRPDRDAPGREATDRGGDAPPEPERP